ncbi:hypothetical protein ACFWPX_01830 [Nocardia sp. NPDC058518]|uniref:hypothetical protein n=1 Tax=Nocardia sp. NPDC058518 TaxID=3346534 RepID=UPI0036494871
MASHWLKIDEENDGFVAGSGARPSDQSRVRNTQNRILNAAQNLVDNAATSGRFLATPSRAQIAELARVHPNTVRTHFQDWSAICAALCERYRVTPGAQPPENVRTWAQQHFDRESTGRPAAAPIGMEELRDRYAAASIGSDDTELALAATDLVDKLSSAPADLPAHAHEIVDCVRTVRARVGINSSESALHTVADLSDAAVQAHRHLATGPQANSGSGAEPARLVLEAGQHGRAGDGAARAHQMVDQALHEPQNLQAIIQIKRWDKEISEKLNLRVRAVLAQFHIDRAEAMICRNPEDEIASLKRVVAALRQLQQNERPALPEHADVGMLVARLAGVWLAYTDLFGNGELRVTRAELLRLFKTDEHESRQLKKDAQSLFKLVDDKPVEAIELLRALRFRGPGDFLIARHLAAQAEMSDEQIKYRFGQALGTPDRVRIFLLNRAKSCYQRVQVTSRLTGCAAALAGMAQAELMLAEHRIDELSRGGPLPTTPTGDQTIEHLQRNINDLVHRAIIGESLDPRQVALPRATRGLPV